MTLSELRIADVWGQLGGAEPRGRRARAFWRDGDGFSVSLDAEKNVFFDFAAGSGGGVLALVEAALGCGRAEALRWLEIHCGLDSAHTSGPRMSPAAIQDISQRLQDFAHGLELSTARVLLALSPWLDEHGVDSSEALQAFHRRAWVLKFCTAADVVHVYRRMQAENPRAADRIQKLGREDRQHAENLTHECVVMIAAAGERKVAA